MSRKIAVIGSNMVDLITYVDRMPVAGETVEAPRFEMGFGGKGSNQAAAAAKLGSPVLMVGKVGDDAFGRNTLGNYRDLGIDARHVAVVPGMSSGVAPIFVTPEGENSILIVKGANGALSPADVDAAVEDLKACSLILLQLEISLETVYHAIDVAARHGIKVLLNPAPATRALDIARIAKVDFFVPNQTELEILTGLPCATAAEAEAAARRLIERGMGRVIVTLGGDGALTVGPEGSTLTPPVKVTPVDTTGAGDAFIGSFAHHYVETGDLAAALKGASAYAAQSILKPGTQKALASREEFDAFLAGLPA